MKESTMHTTTPTGPLMHVSLSVFLLLTMVVSGTTAASVQPPAGLVSWWDGDAVAGTTAKDIHDGNDGTLMGGVNIAPGIVGNAFQFDGSSGNIMIAHETAFDFTTGVSADAWVFISGGDGNYQSVVNKGYYSGGPFELRMTREGDPYPFILGCPDKHVIYFAVTTNNGLQSAGACITKGVWHHVAGTYDGTAVRFYLDGQIPVSPNGTLGEVLQSGTLIQNDLPVSIGWNGAFGEVWAGLIDEVQIFNRALTAAEVQSIFAAGSAGQCKTLPCSLAPATLWMSLKNSDDQGTQFDLRTEVYINTTLVSAGITRCIAGVTRNPTKATEVAVPFGAITNGALAGGDSLSLKVLARIGTNPDDSKCPGHTNAAGLRLYYDAMSRPSRFSAEIAPDPLTAFFLHDDEFLDDIAPTATAATFQDASKLNFSGGNPWHEIGTWSMTLP